MGLDISIKLNKKIKSDYLKEKYHLWTDESDDIVCLSRDYCNLMLMQFEPENEQFFSDLNTTFGYDCSFLQKPKLNHPEESEETLFQFGWLKSNDFLEQLKQLKLVIENKRDFVPHVHWPLEWIEYFITEGSFLINISNLIEVLEIGNQQGVTEVCYVIG